MSYLYLYDVTSPAIASIDICRFDEGHRLSKVLNTVSNVRDLTLSDSAVVGSSDSGFEEDALEAIPQCNLSHLTLSLYNPSSVVVASIDIFEADINDRSSKLLRGICNVKDLLLTDTSIMALSRANLLHTFSDLKHLRVCLYTDEFAGEYLRELLCCLPNLETLCFMNELELCSFEEHGTIPGCVCSHLKSELRWNNITMATTPPLNSKKKSCYGKFHSVTSSIQDELMFPAYIRSILTADAFHLYGLPIGRKFLRGICGVKDPILTDISFMAHRFAFGKHGWTLGTTSQPILSNRKSVKFDEFYGAEKELSVVEVLLKNAKALEKMTIISSSKLSRGSREENGVVRLFGNRSVTLQAKEAYEDMHLELEELEKKYEELQEEHDRGALGGLARR
ncbi:hypothetical protein IFM89_025866 [Coptis chinensis]|uniref:FBD domain-containing protein n=1 Tax=Coptis chinensis TaxID=261450 RepID=A0A835LBR7_9MAGN|nr:hypothetical protein IFM89_025866 [Coptis chinensis]